MRFAVVIFPGSNCEQDVLYAARFLGHEAEYVWHGDTDLAGFDAVVLPGGFSYGDYIRTGAVARFSPIMAEVMRFADAGGPVMGICNGFQILCEAHLLPGAMLRNSRAQVHLQGRRRCAWRTACAGGSTCPPARVVHIPINHNEGNFVVRRRRRSSAERQRPGRAALLRAGRLACPGRLGSQRLAGRHRRHLQRARQRVRAHAAPGARVRPARGRDRRALRSSVAIAKRMEEVGRVGPAAMGHITYSPWFLWVYVGTFVLLTDWPSGGSLTTSVDPSTASPGSWPAPRLRWGLVPGAWLFVMGAQTAALLLGLAFKAGAAAQGFVSAADLGLATFAAAPGDGRRRLRVSAARRVPPFAERRGRPRRGRHGVTARGADGADAADP